MARRFHFKCLRVFNIFNTETAEYYTPISLSNCIVLSQNIFVNTHRIIKFTAAPALISSVKQFCHPIFVDNRKCIDCSAIFAHSGRRIVLSVKPAAAHFTIKRCHNLFPPRFLPQICGLHFPVLKVFPDTASSVLWPRYSALRRHRSHR